MARQLQILPGGALTLPSACVDDEAASASSPLAVTKTRHIHRVGTGFGFLIGDAPTTKEVIVYRAKAAATVRNFLALLNDSGTSTSITFDLKKNGATILSGAVSVVDGTGDRTAVAGTIANATLAAGDVLSVLMTVSSATGAQGPWAELEIDEPAS